MSYPYIETSFRAQCLRVVDGDTVDLYVDCGFHLYRTDRFRLLGVDTAELSSKDPAQRALAQQAKDKLIEWLRPSATPTEWLLRVQTRKDPDSFGRWLAAIWYQLLDGSEVSVADELIRLGLAVPYTR